MLIGWLLGINFIKGERSLNSSQKGMKMKKVLATLFVLMAVFVYAQQNAGVAFTQISEVGTDPATNYYGWARTTENSASTPSTNDAVWKVVRVITDSNGNVIEKKNAYGSGNGDNALWTTAWTNRASATYK